MGDFSLFHFTLHGVILTLDVGKFYNSQWEEKRWNRRKLIVNLPETTPSKVDMEAIVNRIGIVGAKGMQNPP